MLSKTAVIIPIRMHSSRLPGKFHKLIGDKPMIIHVLEKAQLSGIPHVYVAVDHEEHFNLVEKYGGKAIMTSTEHQSGTDRVYEAAQIIDPEEKLEYVINLQGDMPFIKPESISKVVDFKNHDFDISTLATVIKSHDDINNINVVKIAMTPDGNALYFSRSPIPYNAKTYHYHLGIYAFRRSALKKFVNLKQSQLELCERLEQLRALENGMKIQVIEVEETTISVDTEDDMKMARSYFSEQK